MKYLFKKNTKMIKHKLYTGLNESSQNDYKINTKKTHYSVIIHLAKLLI